MVGQPFDPFDYAQGKLGSGRAGTLRKILLDQLTDDVGQIQTQSLGFLVLAYDFE